jgi:hypothetical protein
MGTQPTTQARGNTRSNRRRAGSRPASPIVTDCAAAIDQIINVVHQPAKLTFHRHRALLNAFTTFWKREQTGNKAQSSF